MSKKTISEELFERFCIENGFKFTRIESSIIQGRKEPDYEIITITGRILIEVKQFDPNSEEDKLWQQLKNRGFTDVFGGEPGAKARLKIQSAAKQLKSRGAGSIPSIIVLYNNIPISDRGTDSYEIKTAMYGIEKIVLRVDREKSEINLEDRCFGPKRKMTPNSNTSVSAVATLYKGLDQMLYMSIFHNIYASIPLIIEHFQGSRIKHYVLTNKVKEQFQNWQEVSF